MWTHRHPFEAESLTPGSIERHARMALFRAMAFDRVVAMVGSGLTIGYGQPTWSDVTKDVVVKMMANIIRPTFRADKAFMEEIEVFRGMFLNRNIEFHDGKHGFAILSPPTLVDFNDKAISDETVLALAIAKRLSLGFYTPTRDAVFDFDAAFAERFVSNPASVFEGELRSFRTTHASGITHPASSAGFEHFGSLDKIDALAAMIGSTPLDGMAKVLQNLGASIVPGTRAPKDIDTIGALFRMGTRRFATLNYDVEIEHRIVAEVAPDLRDDGFEGLLSGDPSKRGARSVRKQDLGVGRAQAISVCLQPDSVGELLNMSVYGKHYRYSVGHLHGRADRPKSMVATIQDYIEAYVQPVDISQVYRDARYILFGGNTVLFVGIGMREEDVLSTLRLYFAEQTAGATKDVNAIVLRWASSEISGTLLEEFLSNNHSLNSLRFCMNKFTESLQIYSDEDKRFSLGLREKYGIYTIFYGKKFADLALLWALCKLPYERKRKAKPLKLSHLFHSLVRTVNSKYGFKLFENKDKIFKIYALLHFAFFACDKNVSDFICGVVASHLMSRSLVLELSRLSADQKAWWADWRELPRPRQTIFWRTPTPPTLSPWPVWVRHKVAITSPTRTTGSLKDFIGWIAGVKAESVPARRAYPIWSAATGQRTKRIALRRGDGRGTLLAALQDPIWHGRLFGTGGYHGAFFASTAFGMEFSSAILGLSSFLVEAIGNLGSGPPPTDLEEELKAPIGERRHRLDILHDLFERYAGLAGGKRLFLCLSGMDRLCDRRGDAYSPMHRQFFRLITGASHAETPPRSRPWPIDLLLVAGRGDAPPAYLSLEAPEAGNVGSAASRTGRRWLAWDLRPPMPLDQRLDLICATDSTGLLSGLDKARVSGLFKNSQTDAPSSGNAARRLKESLCLLACWLRLVAEEAASPSDWEAVATIRLSDLSGHLAQEGRGGPFSWILRKWDDLDKARGSNIDDVRLRSALLDHLTIFVTPVPAAAMETLPAIVKLKASPKVSGALGELRRRGLVIAIDGIRNDQSPRYVLHEQIREALARRMGLFVPDGGERNHYQVSLYCAQPSDLPTPNMEHIDWVEEVLLSLVDSSRAQQVAYYRREKAGQKGPPRSAPGDLNIASDRLRAAYSVIRGGFSVSALSRLAGPGSSRRARPPLERYRNWLRRLLNAGVGIDHCATAFNLPSVRQPYYLDEIAWLLNERGLVSLVLGRAFDAALHFERAYEVMRHQRRDEADSSYHAAERRVRVNLVAAYVERGRLVEARQIATEIVQATAPRPGATPSHNHIYARGFLGLCDHLAGSSAHAVESYDFAIRSCTEIRNIRGLAIFQMHKASLLARQHDLDGALAAIDVSISAAAQAEQQDVMHQALLTLANVLAQMGRTQEALGRLSQIDRYAEDSGIMRLQVDSLRVRAGIMLGIGDVDRASPSAARSIAVANLHGMRLRKIHGMTVYGEILHAMGQRDMACRVLEEARDAAERCGYHSKQATAHRLLNRFAHETTGGPSRSEGRPAWI